MFEDSDDLVDTDDSDNTPMTLSGNQDSVVSARKKLEEYMEEQALRRELQDDFLDDLLME